MDRTDAQVLQQAQRWLMQGRRVALGTVVQTWGSAPRPVGALVALCDDGQVVGSVSGGCIEDDLIEQARAGSLFGATPQRLTYGVSADEARRFGLPCGGTLEVVIETLGPLSQIELLLTQLEAGQTTRRHLDLRTGIVTLTPAHGPDALGPDALHITDEALTRVYGPQLRLILIGAGQLSHYLAHMALACDYAVIVCDPREEYRHTGQVPGAQLVHTMPDDTVLALKPDARTAVIALTHDPKLDDLALMEALKSDAFYVGAIGSRTNQAKRRERLLEFGVTPAQLSRLHGPVGLSIGARTPPEIAVAILAELTAARYGVAAIQSSTTAARSPRENQPWASWP